MFTIICWAIIIKLGTALDWADLKISHMNEFVHETKEESKHYLPTLSESKNEN